MAAETLAGWVEDTLGYRPRDFAPFARALTHSSSSDAHYERLEFLGDRVLGLVVADWLYEIFPGEPEGSLSRRLNALVSGETCAEVARDLAIGPQAILGKQAREDGAADSDNVLGDIIEALIGALYLEFGIEPARDFIRKAWAKRIDSQGQAPKHPKSALQEWAAANNRKPPEYEIVDRSGPNHSPRFKVQVSIGKLADAFGEGTSKQEAETAAAAALLEKLEK